MKYLLFISEEYSFCDFEEVVSAVEYGEPYELITYTEDNVFTIVPYLLGRVEELGSYRYLTEKEYNIINEI